MSNGRWYYEIAQYQPPNDKLLWSIDTDSIDKCLNAFLEACIFDGKKFWDAEKDIQWVDSLLFVDKKPARCYQRLAGAF